MADYGVPEELDGEDPTQHAEMETFIRSNAIVEMTPRRAFGIIEREDEFARSATRWSW